MKNCGGSGFGFRFRFELKWVLLWGWRPKKEILIFIDERLRLLIFPCTFKSIKEKINFYPDLLFALVSSGKQTKRLLVSIFHAKN